MQQAAFLEAERIEISQDGRVQARLLKEPMLSQVALRDDFAGIVRLLDAIMSDQAIMDLLKRRMESIAAHGRAAVPAVDEAGDVTIAAEAS